MTERLLQFIWQFRYFNHHDLRLETGEDLAVLSPGKINTHQGPDFLWATVRIGNTIWAGHIELHLLASGWSRHGHGDDKHYNSVILHVVWENDVGGGGCDPRNIPVLVLHDRVPKFLLGRYRGWMANPSFVPCERQLSLAPETIWPEWKQSLLKERLQRRALLIHGFLQENRQHWEETIWWLLARNFGIPVNGDAFEAVARSISVNMLARLRSRPEEVEALLLGQAGLLEAHADGHGLAEGELPMFRKIFEHLRIKYRLEPIHEPILFLRMRPAGFPVRRLRQLAALMRMRSSWFSAIREAGSLNELRVLVPVMSEELGAPMSLPMGLSMRNSILINTMLPFLYAYGWLRGEPHASARAVRWYTGIGAEKNAVLSGWGKLGITARHAADSQALLELKGRYCDHRKCLECGIGKVLLLRA